MADTITIIDSHTGGEPTRTVMSNGPELGSGSAADRLERFRNEFDHYRRAIVNEPRGSNVLVGALLGPAENPEHLASVIFFNNVGYLGMCGHGMIGVVTTLQWKHGLPAGTYTLETPVGNVRAMLHEDGRVSITNVPSYRTHANLEFEVPGIGLVSGDLAYAGNWFLIVPWDDLALSLDQVEELTSFAVQVRAGVHAAGYPQVDHIELSGQGVPGSYDSRNFVLCPGLAYDRSPCGTGTSAKLACLAADSALQPGETWVQAGILGTTFEGRFEWQDESRRSIIPTITGRAFITAEMELILSADDPFAWGITTDAGTAVGAGTRNGPGFGMGAV